VTSKSGQVFARTLGSRIAVMVVILLTLSAAQGQTFKVLHAFGDSSDGSNPQGALLRDRSGNLYGTANIGGNQKCGRFGCGIILKVTPEGKETVLHRFVQTDGALPSANLTPDKAGNLYSTVVYGGPIGCNGNGCGGIFKLNNHNTVTLLYSFTGTTDIVNTGSNPIAGLIRDGSDNFYGVTSTGGSHVLCEGQPGCGTIFKLEATGKLRVLYVFRGGRDGANPRSPLIADHAGNLYGTASEAGRFDVGTVFKLDTKGRFSVIHTFTGTNGDGRFPFGGLVRDAAGNLYGTTITGGAHNSGTVYKLDRSGAETILHAFTGGSDGEFPWASLVIDKQGNLFGTTAFGGAHDDGTVFELDASGKETVLHSFVSATDGDAVIAPVILDPAGNLYGTAEEGGPHGDGTVFEIIR
jgi:uncharacterized repeat protein (TIGR03803 family)